MTLPPDIRFAFSIAKLIRIVRVLFNGPLDALVSPRVLACGVTSFRRRRYKMATVVYLVVAGVGVVFLALSLVTFQSSDK